jgi:ATP phosphoribosyltransferase
VTLRLAVPDGALAAPSLALLAAAGVTVPAPAAPAHEAVGPGVTAAGPAPVTPGDRTVDVAVATVAADDVCAYLAAGAADAGLVTKDVLLERATGLCELLDLRYGAALLLYAVAPGATQRLARLGRLRVATRHPRLARSFLAGRGLQADVIEVAGGLERAVADGLADAVVALAPPSVGEPPTAVGGLVVEGVVAESSVRLTAGRAARVLRAAELAAVVARLRAALPKGET